MWSCNNKYGNWGSEGLSFLLQYTVRGFKCIKLYIKINLREFRWAGMDWINLDQNADQWRNCEHGYEISVSVKCGNSLSSKGTLCLSRRAVFHRASLNKQMP